MQSFILKQKKKIMVVIITVMLVITSIPAFSLAVDGNLPQITDNVKAGRIGLKTAEGLTTELDFTITADSPVRVIYYQWDRRLPNSNTEMKREFLDDNNELSVNFSLKVPFSKDEVGLHEFSIAAEDKDGRMTTWKNIPYYVVEGTVVEDYEDTAPPTFICNTPNDYPYSGSEIEPGRPIKLELKDDNGIYWIGFKWVRTLDTTDYKTDSDFIYNPGESYTFYAPEEPGTWFLQYYCADGSNKLSAGGWSRYIIKDNEAPKLTLNGEAKVDVPLNSGEYDDPGASWTDNHPDAPNGIVYADKKVDTTKVGKQILTYTITDAGNNTSTVTREVTVVGTGLTYELTAPRKIDYNVGEEIDLAGATIKVLDERGNELDPIPVTKEMFSHFSTAAEGEQQALFKYGGKTVIYEYNVHNFVSSVSLLTPPTKTIYEYGDEIDLTGGQIEVRMGSGDTSIIDITDDMIQYDKNRIGSNQFVIVSYGGKDTEFLIKIDRRKLTVTIDNKVSTVGEAQKPLTYQITEGTLAPNETEDVLNINLTTTAGSTVGTYPITGTCGNQKYNVTFINGTYEIKADKYTVTFMNGDQEFASSEVAYNALATAPTTNPTKPADSANTYTFAGWYTNAECTTAFSFDTKITNNTTLYAGYTAVPIETEHNYDYANGTWAWEADGSAATLTATCKNGSHTDEQTAAITSVATPATCTEDGYTTYTATVTVDGIDYTDDKVITDTDSATGHDYDYANGTWEWETDGSAATLTATCKNGSHTDEQTATITSVVTAPTHTAAGYTTYTATVTVNGTPYTDTKVVAGEAALKCIVTFKNYDGTTLGTTSVAYGEEAAYPTTLPTPQRPEDDQYTYEFSGWDKELTNVTGDLIVIAQYTATPKEVGVKSIKVNNPPTTDLEYGDSLPSDITVEVTFEDNTTDTISLSACQVTGYNSRELGEQEVTVTYKDQTDTFTVNVIDKVTGITVTNNGRTNFNFGEDIDTTGIVVTTKMASGETGTNVTSDSTITVPEDASITPGNVTISVKYKEYPVETTTVTVGNPIIYYSENGGVEKPLTATLTTFYDVVLTWDGGVTGTLNGETVSSGKHIMTPGTYTISVAGTTKIVIIEEEREETLEDYCTVTKNADGTYQVTLKENNRDRISEIWITTVKTTGGIPKQTKFGTGASFAGSIEDFVASYSTLNESGTKYQITIKNTDGNKVKNTTYFVVD